MNRGKSLYQLQNLDSELENGQRRISEIKASLGETEALRHARGALTAAEEEHRAWMTKARDLELEIDGLSSKATTSEKRLYSGSITNPKELSDLQNEIASLKRRRSDLEDELLEAMVYAEDAASELETSRVALVNTENDWRANQTALESELSELETQVTGASEQREKLRSTTAADELALYDKVQARYGSITVTTLRDGVCGYCAVAPSSTKLSRLRGGREVLHCGNCGRILLALG